VFNSKDAIVLISKSIEVQHCSIHATDVITTHVHTYILYQNANYAPKDGVIRVDNYWCKSAFISTHERQAHSVADGDGGRDTIVAATTDSDHLRSVGSAVTSVIDHLHLDYQKTAASPEGGPMLLSTLERNRPKLQIKRRMLRRVHDAMKLKQRLQLRHSPVVGLYFHRNHMSSSCNSVDNLDFVSINGRANPAPYKGRGTAYTPTSDPSHSIKRISSSSNPTSPEDKSTSPSPTTHHRPRVRNIDRPGMKFVTIFCDDQKVTSHLHAYIQYSSSSPLTCPRCMSYSLLTCQVPLPAAVTDILSKQGEKVNGMR
jgi:hypothetical protein